MPLRFLADMGVSPLIVSWLRSQGHEATHLSEQGLQRMTDRAVFQKAATEHRILLTFDLDFGEIAALSGIEPVTVILFRLANTHRKCPQPPGDRNPGDSGFARGGGGHYR